MQRESRQGSKYPQPGLCIAFLRSFLVRRSKETHMQSTKVSHPSGILTQRKALSTYIVGITQTKIHYFNDPPTAGGFQKEILRF